LSTKLHLAAAAERTAVTVVLTPGPQGDAKAFPAVWAGVPAECRVLDALADKAYDRDAIRATLLERAIEPVIPPKANRKEPLLYDEQLYRQRNRAERLVGKLKQFRRIATR
jgi:transposase